MEYCNGGVTAAKGFTASGVHCGIRKSQSKLDLGLIYSETPCTAAGVYTQNLVKGAPILVDQEHLQNGTAQAIIVNSGIANTCAPNGLTLAKKMCEQTASLLQLQTQNVLVASTGVIGVELPIEKIEEGLPALKNALNNQDGGKQFAQSIMTTDTISKEIAVTFLIDGKTCTLGGCAKGSGMINPNMATMLSFLTTDTNIAKNALETALLEVTKNSFNMVSVDGDTSTNDTVLVLANGLAQNSIVELHTPAYQTFLTALQTVCIHLAKMLAKDGEGATKLVECTVANAPTTQTAKVLAKSVINSSLVKAAMFGSDANWGRILCALGYAQETVDLSKTKVTFQSTKGCIVVCENGAGIPFSEPIAKEILEQNEIQIIVDLFQGNHTATAWGCDLSYDYVKINGDYRS